MLPDWRQPDTTPSREPADRRCDICRVLLPPDRLRCDRCLEAASQAIAEAGGQAVWPSMIAAARERMDQP